MPSPSQEIPLGYLTTTFSWQALASFLQSANELVLLLSPLVCVVVVVVGTITYTRKAQ